MISDISELDRSCIDLAGGMTFNVGSAVICLYLSDDDRCGDDALCAAKKYIDLEIDRRCNDNAETEPIDLHGTTLK